MEEVPEFKKAIVELETMYFNESEIDIYDARLKWFRDQHSELMYVRNRCLKQGKEKGLKEGREVGIKEGKEKGRDERNYEFCKRIQQNSLKRYAFSRNFPLLFLAFPSLFPICPDVVEVGSKVGARRGF